jgi:predicted RNA binding protein YcfA (HicA-like mRNA interferase family)
VSGAAHAGEALGPGIAAKIFRDCGLSANALGERL